MTISSAGLPGTAAKAARLAARAPAMCGLLVLLVISATVMRWVVGHPHAWEQWASTNIVNLHRHPVTALVASAFVAADGLGYDLLLLAVAGIALEVRVGWRRTLAVAATGHVIATLITEGAVLLAIRSGYESGVAARQLDVGISYVTWTLVGAALRFVPPRWRKYTVAAACAYLGFQLSQSWDMTAWGHVLSLLIGFLSWPLLKRMPRRVSVMTPG